MVKVVKIKAYKCEVCGETLLDRAKAIKHEKSPEKPQYKINENVYGHCRISKVENSSQEYVFTSFKVLKVKKIKHSFIYLLDPQRIEVFHSSSGFYSSPSVSKRDSQWYTPDKEDKAIINSLEGRINTSVALTEDKLRPQLRLRHG